MTAAGSAGAASPGPWTWHQLHWGAVHRNVRRLQARIVQTERREPDASKGARPVLRGRGDGNVVLLPDLLSSFKRAIPALLK